MWRDVQRQLDTYIETINEHSNTLDALTDEQETSQREIERASAGLKKAVKIRSKLAREAALGLLLAHVFDLCERYMNGNDIPIPQESTD